MGRNGVADHVHDGDFLQKRLCTRHIHKAAAELLQQGLAVHTGEQNGRMSLREHLRSGIHRHLHLHGIRELLGDEGGRERNGVILHLIRNLHHKAVTHHLAGRNGNRDFLHLVAVAKLQAAGNRLVGNTGNGEGRLVAVSRIQELRLHQRHLHRQRHHHLLLHQRIAHILSVCVYRYIIGT